ncbi:hypothetical protein SNE40_013655 [Patella caerulea]|uniref:Uncharacterized protein n=1 Tax=Patella caerulea TaxID=87958 RepID=A0AAN8JCR1_PATCE
MLNYSLSGNRIKNVDKIIDIGDDVYVSLYFKPTRRRRYFKTKRRRCEHSVHWFQVLNKTVVFVSQD